MESALPGDSFLQRLAAGDSLIDAGHFAAAYRTYDTLARANPDSTQLNMRLLKVCQAVGLHDRADALLKQMTAQDTVHREPGYWKGILSLFSISKGDTLSLRKQTHSLLSMASDANPDLYETAAFNEVFLREFDQAIQHYERWVSLANPEVPPPNLGFLYLKSGRDADGRSILDQAELRTREAVSASPGDWENWFELAEITSMRGDTATALRHLQKALETGLEREWWLMMEKGPGSIPDPVFETILYTKEYQKLMEPVFQARARMLSEIGNHINSK